jgi:hypothetical protein
MIEVMKVVPGYTLMTSEKARSGRTVQIGVPAKSEEAVQSSTAMALYPRIIGDAWGNLSPPVQRLHSTGTAMRGVGSFIVRHGSRRSARLLTRLLRMPAAGENVSVGLVVTPCSDGERWHRTFAGRPFITEQRDHAGKLLAERMGVAETWFRLVVKDGALFYHQTRFTLHVGPWRVPLPGWLSPRIVASEQASAGKTCVHVSVRVTAPLIGLLIAYGGNIEMEEAGA